MKVIPAVGAVILLAGSIFALNIVFHLYTDHEHLDVFHLIVGTLSAVLALLLMRRALPTR